MEVFVVFRGSYEDCYADTVHATLASAQATHEHPESWREVTQGLWTCEWSRVVHHAKVPVTVVHFETRRVEVDSGGVATLPDGRKVAAQGYYVDVPVWPDGTEWVGEVLDTTETCDAGIQSFPVVG